jgi:hypothetical protein
MRDKVLLAVLSVLAFSAAASGDQAGIWVKVGDPAQVNVGCTQVWQCGPRTDIFHSEDTHIVATPNEITVGVCSAGGGAVDSCNVCLVSEPSTPCTWHLENN